MSSFRLLSSLIYRCAAFDFTLALPTRLVVSPRSLLQARDVRCTFARTIREKKVSLLWLGHRRRRLSRPYRLGIFDLQHVERFSQTVVRRSRHFPRHFFVDPVRRDSHRRCRGAGGRHVDGPLGRALADGGGRFDFRRRFYLFGSSAGFHPVHAGALAAHQSRRFVDGLHGGQRFDRALVRAHARPRPGDRQHGPWLG